ncbi:30S ribosomal protein S20 [bacterium]|nr:30S ribosomal protein S20 [bacterium]
MRVNLLEVNVLPHNKSCKKRLITSAKRRERNRVNKATMRSALKKYRSLPEGAPERQEQLNEMYSRMDTLARKGIIPRKRADRLKSRLAAHAAR